jgi:hypothetical protein
MTDHAHPFKRLSAAEARRALYIDFEGQKDEPPVLLGVHRHGRGSRPFAHQVVMDQAFASLAEPVMSLREAVEKVVLRADHGDRRIVSWSEHDLNVVRTLAVEDPDRSSPSRPTTRVPERSPSAGATGSTAGTSRNPGVSPTTWR